MRLLTLMTHTSPWSNELAGSLAQMGHEIFLLDYTTTVIDGLTTNAKDTTSALSQYKGVHLVSRPRSTWGQHFALIGPLRRIARSFRPHLVLCLYAGRYAVSAYLSAVRPYAVYVVGSDVLLASRGLRLFNKLTLGSAACVFANGEHLAAQARRQAASADIETLLIGVDTEKFQPQDRLTVPRIFNHRFFAPMYDNETIVRALASLSEDVPPFQMIFASAGPELGNAMALADSLLPARIRSYVQFWGGDALRADLVASLAQTDLYISMSRSDGTSTAVLEAMSCGAYPILSDIPANRPLVDPERGIGTLVSPRDYLALAARIEAALLDISRIRSAAPAIRRHVSVIADAARNRCILAQRLELAAQRADRSHGRFDESRGKSE